MIDKSAANQVTVNSNGKPPSLSFFFVGYSFAGARMACLTTASPAV
jgi:hypothetical protein